MSSQPDTREVIPSGEQEFGWEHLIPVAKLLIERGHPPISDHRKFGFASTAHGVVCGLARKFTPEDWDAINEKFVMPDNVVYFHGLIRDNANGVDMIGWDQLASRDGIVPIEVWVEQEREAGRL